MNVQLSRCFLEVESREDALLARFTQPVSLCGELAETVAEQLVSLLSEPGRQRLLVDFSNVQSVTSFMLGQLVRLSRIAKAADRQFALFNLPPHIREILEVSRLSLLLSLCEDESAALHVC